MEKKEIEIYKKLEKSAKTPPLAGFSRNPPS
jgi:hypothetical protein